MKSVANLRNTKNRNKITSFVKLAFALSKTKCYRPDNIQSKLLKWLQNVLTLKNHATFTIVYGNDRQILRMIQL